MKHIMPKAKECLSILPIYAGLDDTIEALVLKMLEFNTGKILVCDRCFKVLNVISKNEILKFFIEKKEKISKDLLSKYRVKDILDTVGLNKAKFAAAYLGSDLVEIINAMRTLEVNYMPILKSPWNKTLKGFIRFDEVQKFLELIS